MRTRAEIKERREKILELLKSSNDPVSGQFLCDTFKVTRPIIVEDIKFLRGSETIISTHTGYLLSQPKKKPVRVIKVKHALADIELECKVILGCGGVINDVFVEHRVYGRIMGELNITTQTDVDDLLRCFKSGVSRPLCEVTSGYHYHTITADNEEILDKIEEQLGRFGFLTK